MRYAYDLGTYADAASESPSHFRTFINKESLAAGVLVLGPGQEDTQGPHDSDEVYLVVSGSGYLEINGRSYRARRNSVFFVPRGAPHRFHGNACRLTVLYFFGGPD